MKRYTVEVYRRYEGGRGQKLYAMLTFNGVEAMNKDDAFTSAKARILGQKVKDIDPYFPIDFEHDPKAWSTTRTIEYSKGKFMTSTSWSMKAVDVDEHIINEHDFEHVAFKIRLER